MARTIEESNYVLPGDQSAAKATELKRQKKWPGYHFCLVTLSPQGDELREFLASNPFHVHLTEGMSEVERAEFSQRRDTVVMGLKDADYKRRRQLLDEKAARMVGDFNMTPGATIGEMVASAKSAPVTHNDD